MRALVALLLALGPAAAARAADVDRIETVDTQFQSIVVRPGDTLWSIAHKYLKDPAKWDEILKHNRLPTSDPTVALPGMTLRVPVRLIKTALRAARLAYAANRVLDRRKDTAEWRPSKTGMELFQGDTLRTLEESKARVKFLNTELLNLEPNSMAVIKPVDDPEADIILRSGSVFAGRARVVTSSARVTPRTKDTRYSASVEPDLTTKVEVFRGRADVEAQGARVDVPAGMQTRVAPGLAPQVPRPLENLPALEARAQEFSSAVAVGGGAAPQPRLEEATPVPEADAASLRGDLDSLRVGVPILGYHVQASKGKDFAKPVFDKKYDSEERFTPADTGLPPGAYWWRVAVIDLLGTEANWSEARYYTVGIRRAETPKAELSRSVITIMAPAEGAEIASDAATVIGVLRDDRLQVSVAGRPVRIDADGNFVATVPLSAGLNEIEILVTDGKGSETRISRRVTRR